MQWKEVLCRQRQRRKASSIDCPSATSRLSLQSAICNCMQRSSPGLGQSLRLWLLAFSSWDRVLLDLTGALLYVVMNNYWISFPAFSLGPWIQSHNATVNQDQDSTVSVWLTATHRPHSIKLAKIACYCWHNSATASVPTSPEVLGVADDDNWDMVENSWRTSGHKKRWDLHCSEGKLVSVRLWEAWTCGGKWDDGGTGAFNNSLW